MKCLCVTAHFEKYKIRKIRDAIPSVPGLLEQLRENPDNAELDEYSVVNLKLYNSMTCPVYTVYLQCSF